MSRWWWWVRFTQAENKKRPWRKSRHQRHLPKLTLIICVEFGFELFHLPLISKLQRSFSLQRPHSLLLFVLRHLMNEGVLLVVGDSWIEHTLARGFPEEETLQTGVITSAVIRESASAILLHSLFFLYISFSLLWNRSEEMLAQSQQTKMGAEEEKSSRKTYKQTFSNKAFCQAHIPLLLTQLRLMAAHYNWNEQLREHLCDRKGWHVGPQHLLEASLF